MSKVTDPELIKILNQKAGIGASSKEVTDPDLINILNEKAGFPSTKKKSATQELLSQIPESEKRSTMDDLIARESQEGVKKLAGYGTMFLAPEIKLGSMLPQAIKNVMPKVNPMTKTALDYLGNIGKVGAAGYAGTKILPDTSEKEAQVAGALGAGTTAVVTPVMVALANTNPYVRMLAGAGLGGLTGAAVGQFTGGSPYLTGLGGFAGGLYGLGGRGASQLAAKDIAAALTPEQIAQGISREGAASRLGVPLTLAEKTGSPVLGAMQQEAAASAPGSKILYPYGIARQGQEEKAYQKLIETISPAGAKGSKETEAFNRAFQTAKEQKTKVDVGSIVNFIDNKLKNFEPGSKISKALTQAKERLSIIPATTSKNELLLNPAKQQEAKLENYISQLKKYEAELKANPVIPYYAESSGYNQRLKDIDHSIRQHEAMLDNVRSVKKSFIKENEIGNYENTVEGLHNAKMGIRGILESQGEQAIGKTASGQLKQVDKMLTQKIKDVSPQYARATRISNLRQARDQIETAMEKSRITGSDFYNKVLQNKNEFDALLHRLRDQKNPNKTTPAQQALIDMREIYPDLLDNLTARSGQAIAKTGKEGIYSFEKIGKSLLNKAYLDRYNKAVAELMINPNWLHELDKIKAMKSGQERGIQLGRLISKVGMSLGMGAYTGDIGKYTGISGLSQSLKQGSE